MIKEREDEDDGNDDDDVDDSEDEEEGGEESNEDVDGGSKEVQRKGKRNRGLIGGHKFMDFSFIYHPIQGSTKN